MSHIYLEAHALSCHMGQRTLFTIPHLTIAQGDKIGLTGPNGGGKTTLLALLAGQLSPQEGHVQAYQPVTFIPALGRGDSAAAPRALKRFGVKEDQAHLSGGEEARLRLSQAEFSPHQLFLMDEPSAHLDSQGMALLYEKLSQLTAYVVVSHDRQLLNQQCNKIWYLAEGVLQVYPGNYDSFLEAQAQMKLSQQRAYGCYTQEKEHLTTAIADTAQRAAKVKNAPARMGNSEARLHRRGGGNTARKRLDNARKAMTTRLDQLEKVERPKDIAPIQLDFSLACPPQTAFVAKATALTYGFEYPLVESADFTLPNKSKTAIMGPNGCGKTTLIHYLLDGHPAITVTPKARLGHLSQDFSTLQNNKTVLENALGHAVQSQTTVRTVLSRLLFSRQSMNQLADTLSMGERLKLCLCQLICGDANVLLLDEPTNYLDLPSRQAMEDVLKEYPGTLVFICHDSTFISALATRLMIFENRRLTTYEGTLESYEQSKAAPSGAPMDKTLLQMRMAQLIQQLSTASNAQREQLEAEYETCLQDYRKITINGKDQ